PPVVVSPVPPAPRREAITAFPPSQSPRETVSAAPPTGTAASGTSTPATPPADRGYIRIQINPPKSTPPDPAPDRGGPREETGDPLLKAQTLQSVGKWREAIAWFRNAEFAGADPGDCNQGMALCHQRLAEWDSARASYRKAIAAFEKHRGTPRWRIAERSWSACKAALEVLGG
ncbi:MAG: tetratricopeptide repeat protein, partial [Armatimonadota bacterium]